MKVCIIIPFYNEAKRFNTEELLNFTSNYNVDFFLINDGSTDTTESLIQQLAEEKEFILSLSSSKNLGKAEAIRIGIKEAFKNESYTHFGYLDADFATPLYEIDNLINTSINHNKSFVMGSRIKRLGADINRFTFRHIFGRIIATIISEFILKLGVYDTQCGAKLFSRDVTPTLFDMPFKSKWLFDVELIYRLKKKYGVAYCKATIYEYPLNQWEDKGGSKITFLDMLQVPIELFKIYVHYR